MNKAVLMSIQPKWCELIANGKKTIEVRRTHPKLQTPFKCYIYETKGRCDTPTFIDEDGRVSYRGRGAVIGEFVCDKLYDITYLANYTREGIFFSHHGKEIDESQDIDAFAVLDETCLDMDDIIEYMGKTRECYGWHISELKIYDKPKELGEFSIRKKCTSCKRSDYESTACMYDEDCIVPVPLTCPPQSWCYVKENKE